MYLVYLYLTTIDTDKQDRNIIPSLPTHTLTLYQFILNCLNTHNNYPHMHSDGDGPWENQSLPPPLQNTGKRKLPMWRRRPYHRPSTQQMSNVEYTKRKIQTQRPKDWELTTKGTKYRVIHKTLRKFRTRMSNNQDRHGRKEYINR